MRSGLEGGLDSLGTSAISKTLPFRLFLPEGVLEDPVTTHEYK